MDLEVARNFVVALLIGALVGIDRERKKATESGRSFGGIRTHILFALVGAVSARLAIEREAPWVLVVALAVVGAAVVAGYVRSSREPDEPYGLTSEMAAMVVFLLGAMTVSGEAELAVALGVVTSAVLAFKEPLHGAVQRLDTADVFADFGPLAGRLCGGALARRRQRQRDHRPGRRTGVVHRDDAQLRA
jgi:hypothetical protein